MAGLDSARRDGGARALYLGNTAYRIHGTNQPATIGGHVSSGCIRMLNEDVMDLFDRVQVGTRVVVLPNSRGRDIAGTQPAGYASTQSAARAQPLSARFPFGNSGSILRPSGLY